jgi:tetratricopeptide (TPR) repeat protein
MLSYYTLKGVPMSDTSIAQQIGRAWRYYREGKADTAITEFERILQKNGDDIDANYGIGLAQNAAGRKTDAVRHFQKAQELVTAAIAKQPKREGNIASPADDRLMMLSRMIGQRLSELS